MTSAPAPGYHHPGGDHRPAERTVGYGTAHEDGVQEVACSSCKAPVGTACTKRGGGTHTTRVDKARRFYQGKASKVAMERERVELLANPDGPLWSFQGLPHRCGTLGVHVLTECTPPPA